MKHQSLLKTFLQAGVLMAVITAANAVPIIDTGYPESWPDAAGDPILDSGQWLAGKFTLSSKVVVTGVEGYLSSTSQPGQFSVAIYSDGIDVPANLIFLATAEAPGVSFDVAGNALPVWAGPLGLHWLLPPGSYWVAFEVRTADSFNGFMANPASSPFLSEALGSGVGGTGDGGYSPESSSVGTNVVDIAVRIFGEPLEVPEPKSGLLVFIGFAALAQIRSNQHMRIRRSKRVA